MNIKEIDQLISSFLLTALFMFVLSIVFVFSSGMILNLDSTIVFNYIVIPVLFGVFFTLKGLDITLLSDICKKV